MQPFPTALSGACVNTPRVVNFQLSKPLSLINFMLPKPPSKNHGKKPIILIADDEDRNRRLMEALLLPMGYEVLTAVNGEDVIEKAKETSPDVILMDVMMPVMDGFEALKVLKQDEETRIIPVVMVTALREVNDRAGGRRR